MVAYLLGGDHDADLLDGLCELLRFDCLVVVKIEVLEALEEDLFLALGACLLGELLDQLLLKTTQKVGSAGSSGIKLLIGALVPTLLSKIP